VRSRASLPCIGGLAALIVFISVVATPSVCPASPEGSAPFGMESIVNRPGECLILYFAAFITEDFQRIMDLGYNATYSSDVGDLTSLNLAGYDALVVWNTGPGLIGDQRAEIAAFVSAGGSLFIHEPDAGICDYVPDGFEIGVAGSDWCHEPTPDYWSCITDFNHPITNGLSNGDLTASWRLVAYLGPEYTVLTRNCVCLDPALAVGVYGSGRILMDTGYFSPHTLVPGSDTYIMRLLDYLCREIGVEVDERSWGSIKAGYRDATR
jgi:hypothetical protein